VRLGDQLRVFLPFGLHHFFKGFIIEADRHVGLRVDLSVAKGNTSAVEVVVATTDRTLRRFTLVRSSLDQATTKRVGQAPWLFEG